MRHDYYSGFILLLFTGVKRDNKIIQGNSMLLTGDNGTSYIIQNKLPYKYQTRGLLKTQN